MARCSEGEGGDRQHHERLRPAGKAGFCAESRGRLSPQRASVTSPCRPQSLQNSQERTQRSRIAPSSVSVVIYPVDVISGNSHRPSDVAHPVTTTALTIDITV